MKKQKKIIIIAPFWGQTNHVGMLRVDRFLRWLAKIGVFAVIVRSGANDRETEKSWGIELEIKNPVIGALSDEIKNYRFKKAAYLLLGVKKFFQLKVYPGSLPDAGKGWAQRVATHPLVLGHALDCEVVLSSSPPESCHLASYLLAKKTGARLIVDMRDGWLDEPLRHNVDNSVYRRWLEAELEKKILLFADHIFVTSRAWKKLIEDRLSFCKGKITVLTNSYPENYKELYLSSDNKVFKEKGSREMTLIHVGQLSASRSTQRVELLLLPIFDVVKGCDVKGTIQFIGRMTSNEKTEVDSWHSKFSQHGWNVEILPPIPREHVFERISASDGLLLLCASSSAIPSKVFEYLPSCKPILAITPQGGALWELLNGVPQIDKVNTPYSKFFAPTIKSFISKVQSGDFDCEVPSVFSESHLSKVFLEVIKDNFKA